MTTCCCMYGIGDPRCCAHRAVVGYAPARQGWQCPQCGRVYAPGLPGCTACNAAVGRKKALAGEAHPGQAPVSAWPARDLGFTNLPARRPDEQSGRA